AHLSQTRNNVGDARARPRPLTEAVQAFLVNVDDDNRPLRRLARMQDLKEVKDADTKLLQQDRIGKSQRHEPDEQQESEPPGQAKSPRQSCKTRHSKLPATRRSAAVHSLGTPA